MGVVRGKMTECEKSYCDEAIRICNWLGIKYRFLFVSTTRNGYVRGELQIPHSKCVELPRIGKTDNQTKLLVRRLVNLLPDKVE